jgi:hypothetical protein
MIIQNNFGVYIVCFALFYNKYAYAPIDFFTPSDFYCL